MTRRWMLCIGAIACLTLAAGCGGGGGGGDDDDGVNGSVGPFNFTEDNMTVAATVAVQDSELYAELSEITLGLITRLAGEGVAARRGPRSAPVLLDLGQLAICFSGSAGLVWDDADANGALSVGDGATVTFSACDLEGDPSDPASVVGVLDLLFSFVDLPGEVRLDLSADVTIQELADGAPTSSGFSAEAGVTVTTADGTLYSIAYDFSDSHEILTGRLEGETAYRFSCGLVVISLSLADPSTFTLSQDGVVSVPGMGIMSITTPGDPMSYLVGLDGSYPDSGQWQLHSLGECAALGVPGGVSDSTEQVIQIVALAGGGDDLRLELYDGAGALLALEDTSYSQLSGDDGDGAGQAPSAAVLLRLAQCYTVGSSDLGEFAEAFIILAQTVDNPAITLPDGYTYDPATGAFSLDLHLDGDGIPEQVTGTVGAIGGTNLTTGVPAGGGFTLPWELSANELAAAAGGLSFIKLSELYRITIFEEPTFSGSGTCGEVRVTGLDLHGELAALEDEWPTGNINFTATSDGEVLTGFVILPSVSGEEATLTGTIGGDTYDFSIDLDVLDSIF